MGSSEDISQASCPPARESALSRAEGRTAICEELIADVAERCGAQRAVLVLDATEGPRVAACRLPAGEDSAALLTAAGPWLAEARLTGKACLWDGPEVADSCERRSCLVVPLRRGHEHIGTIYADVDARHGRLGRAERDWVAALARHGAVALTEARAACDLSFRLARTAGELAATRSEQQQLLKEAAQHNAELAVVTGIQQGLVANLDLDAIVEVVGEKLREVFDTDSIAIAWLDEDNMLVRPVYVCENGVRLPRVASFTATPSEASHRMVRERAAVVVNRVDPASEQVVPGTKLPRSYMRAPVLNGERVIGVVNIDNFERTDAFGDADVRLLCTVTSTMSIALQTARLLEETQRLLKEAQRRSLELAVINEIQQGLAQAQNVDTISRVVADKLLEVLDLQGVAIGWWDEELEQIRFINILHKGQQSTRGLVYPISALGPPGRLVLVERRSLMASTWAEQEVLGMTCIPGTPRSLSVASAPIIGGERVLGMLIVEDIRREHAFDASTLRLLEAVGASMGLAMENLRLQDGTQSRAIELATSTAAQPVAS